MKFRKKSVVIEAVQFTGSDSYFKMPALFDDKNFIGKTSYFEDTNDLSIFRTPERDHKANIGDWIIKGAQGEYYPCKPDIFEATYERVEPEEL